MGKGVKAPACDTQQMVHKSCDRYLREVPEKLLYNSNIMLNLTKNMWTDFLHKLHMSHCDTWQISKVHSSAEYVMCDCIPYLYV